MCGPRACSQLLITCGVQLIPLCNDLPGTRVQWLSSGLSMETEREHNMLDGIEVLELLRIPSKRIGNPVALTGCP